MRGAAQNGACQEGVAENAGSKKKGLDLKEVARVFA